MPLHAPLQRRAAERNPLIERDVVSDLRRAADYNPHAVIDERPPPDSRAGMDFDSGQKPPQVRNEAPEQFQPPHPEAMRDPVAQNGMETGIAQRDLEPRPRRGVVRHDGANILGRPFEHGI